ncbi:MAG: hypothetical protein L3J47_01605 [Sulfurovum sp.]|nr:hypothetical protein [Sulfurovum sp.]
MHEKQWFFLYFVVVILLGVVHQVWLMVAVIVATLILNGKAGIFILKKALWVLLVFNGTVTLSYLVYAYYVSVDTQMLWLLNFRALAITTLTFTLMHHINLHKVLDFNHGLSVLYAFSFSQMMHLKKMLKAFYEGLISRGATTKSMIRRSQLAPLLETLFSTMLHQTGEQSLGMRSRGLIDD